MFSVPVVLVATNKTALRLSSLSTFATDDGDENDDVKNLEKLLLFPPPGPICLDCFEEEEDGKEEAQQKRVVVVVVVVKVEKLLLMRGVFWMLIPQTDW